MSSLKFASAFVTGGNRGIGLEIVTQLTKLQHQPTIIVTYRDESTSQELFDLAKLYPRLKLIKFDVTNYDQLPEIVKTVQDSVGQNGLNLLINNAGRFDRHLSSLDKVSAENMIEHYKINTLAPLIISKHFLPLLKQAAEKQPGSGLSVNKAAIINITSKMGAMSDNTSGSNYNYRVTKAGLNMVTNTLAVDLSKEEILCCVLNPGWIPTRMGGPQAIHNITENVTTLINTLGTLNEEHNGKMYDYNGSSIPW